MIEELREEEIVKKIGGRFKLSTLIQKRLVQIIPTFLAVMLLVFLLVRLLPGDDGVVRYAAVTGRFHLDRSAHGEVTKDDGVFSLLWEKTPSGWKIILDHSS